MPAFAASAPGKIILFGEHAVVYGQPAIAVPVTQVKARATVMPNVRGTPGEVAIKALDIGLDEVLDKLPEDDPIRAAVAGLMAILNISTIPACSIKITSTIPVASGLGSGAAVSVALIRALAGFLGRPLADETVSKLAFEVEKIHHGTPSGIDNSVVTYAVPVFFIKAQPLHTIEIREPFTLVIGDTGVSSPTRGTVNDVRLHWQADPARYERMFAEIGRITKNARRAIKRGNITQLGVLMDENQTLLREMGVSSPELDRLVASAKSAGAWGAKLSGGGRGGNMIALTSQENAAVVSEALRHAGAVNTILTQVRMPGSCED